MTLEIDNSLNFYLGICTTSWFVRPWKNGDKIRPLGMKGSKKISDILIDKKIPLIDKEKTFVITSNGHIIWLIGYTMNDLFKINNTTNRVYKIERISS